MAIDDKTPAAPPPRNQPATRTTPEAHDVPTQFSADQISTPPTSAPFIDTVLVDIKFGPWRGSVYHLPNADAVAAVDAKWAVIHDEKPHDENAEPPPPLTAEEQEAATAAAEAYAAAQAEPPPEASPPEGGATKRRELNPADKPGGYATRDVPRPTNPVPPRRG